MRLDAVATADMPFAQEEGDSIVAVWDRVEFLVPESYFAEPPLAEDMGGSVDLLCFVDVRAYEKEGSKARTFGIRLPARVRVRYTEASIEADEDGDKVRVFSSKAGDILIDDVNVVQSSDNVSGLFRVLAGARITGVSYVDLASLFIDGAKLNGAGTGVTRSVLEAVISEMARWDKDASIPLRVPLAAGKASEDDFRFVKLKDLPRLNSVFTGIGFEDIQLAVQSGVRKTMSGEKQRTSPMEELVKL
jgi:hypothetical protein